MCQSALRLSVYWPTSCSQQWVPLTIPLTAEETQAQRVMCSRSNSRQVAESGSKPRQCSSRAQAQPPQCVFWFYTGECVLPFGGELFLSLTLCDSGRLESAHHCTLATRVGMCDQNDQADEWIKKRGIKKMWNTDTIKYNPVSKKKEILSSDNMDEPRRHLH